MSDHPSPRPRPRPPTPVDINRQQGFASPKSKTEAANSVVPARAPPTVVKAAVPATIVSGLPVVPSTPRSTVDDYLDTFDPVRMVGRRAGFDIKGARHRTADDDETISETTPFVFLGDQTAAGYCMFDGPGNPPTVHMGLIFDGFVVPPRSSMGHTDESQWEIGLDGKPSDPQQLHVYLVFENTETRELITWVANSKTSRSAANKLIRHFHRVSKTDSSFYPLVLLKVGGFQHKDPRVGWVPVPTFTIAGRIPRADAAKPDAAQSGLPNDEIPF